MYKKKVGKCKLQGPQLCCQILLTLPLIFIENYSIKELYTKAIGIFVSIELLKNSFFFQNQFKKFRFDSNILDKNISNRKSKLKHKDLKFIN